MPWRETSPMDQRTQFIAEHLRNTLTITELCELYDISRKTGYKWIDRYLRQGPAGLEERSRRPQHSPWQTSAEIVSAILDARRRHPTWAVRSSSPCGTSSIRAGAGPPARRPATS
jgi:putative transposase